MRTPTSRMLAALTLLVAMDLSPGAATAPSAERAPDGIHVPPALGPGIFLVATPALTDPNFARSVVLLISHDESGSLGLVINRRSGYTLRETLPQFEALENRPDKLFMGGPVEPDRITILYRYSAPLTASEHVVDDVYVSASDTLFRELLAEAAAPAFIVFSGYAGWAPGQLEGELEFGSWRLAKVESSLIFDRAVEEIWPELIRRTEGIWATLSRSPSSS